MSRVLLTGGSGFIASHILDGLLQNEFDVVITVRSAVKGREIADIYPEVLQKRLSFVIVEDISKPGAFDEAVKADPPFDFVIHTASPYHLNVHDPVKEFHEPAVNGTTSILQAVADNAPTVRRIVLTSTFGTIVNPNEHAKVYDETSWGSITSEQMMDPRGAYRASKILAERAAWKFMEERKPPFDLVTIHPPLVYGPIQRFLHNLDELNASNQRILSMVRGETRDSGLPPTVVYIFADVRDVALAHVRALQRQQAGNQRFLVTSGHYSNKAIADAIQKGYPQFTVRLPPDALDDTPADVYGYDNRKSREVLGLTYRTIEECVQDTVASILALEQPKGERSGVRSN